MGVGGKNRKLVLVFESVTQDGRELLGRLVLPDALAVNFSKQGTAGARADWTSAAETIASEIVADVANVKGSI